MAQVAEPGLRSARLIAIVLSAGVVMFWIIAWVVLTEAGRGGMAPGAMSRELALWIWGATALAGLAAAMLFRGRALDEGEPAGWTLVEERTLRIVDRRLSVPAEDPR